VGRFVVGITGSFFSGKTTAAKMFAEKGALLIDADRISADLIRNDKALRPFLKKLAGEPVFRNGKIVISALRAEVLRNDVKFDELCSLLHPLIIARIKCRLSAVKSGTVIMDVPLLIEAGIQDMADHIIVVTADQKLIYERALSEGYSKWEIDVFLRRQMPAGEKVRYADTVIENNGSINKLKQGVDRTWQTLKKRRNWT
jgi:dephospho-CoA kinase